MLSNKQQELQVQCYALIQQALRQHGRKLRRDRIDGLVAFLRRLVMRAGERSYLVLKPTVEERAWRKDVKDGSAERPVCAKTMQRYCHDLVELGLAKLRHFDQHTGITLLFLKRRKVSAPPQEVSALTDSCGGLPPTEAKPSAVDGQAQPEAPASAEAEPGAPVEGVTAGPPAGLAELIQRQAAANAAKFDSQRPKVAWASDTGEDYFLRHTTPSPA